jgi:hypothetical protein
VGRLLCSNSQREAIDIDALCHHHLGLPIERQVTIELIHDHKGEQGKAGVAQGNDLGRNWRLHDLLVCTAAILRRLVWTTRQSTSKTSSISSSPSGRRRSPQSGGVQVPASGSICRSAPGRCVGRLWTRGGSVVVYCRRPLARSVITYLLGCGMPRVLSQSARVEHWLLTSPDKGCFQASSTNPPSPSSTFTVTPSATSPRRIASASGSCRYFCTARFNGLAP